jgi:hypothetical protein
MGDSRSDDGRRVRREDVANTATPLPLPDDLSDGKYRVFISYGTGDGFLVRELVAKRLTDAGAEVFIDSLRVEFGDRLPDEIFIELQNSNELCLLLTPTSLLRPWVFAELGAAILRNIRIVPIMYGVTEADLQAKGIASLLGSRRYLVLDELDSYARQLKARIARHRHD